MSGGVELDGRRKQNIIAQSNAIVVDKHAAVVHKTVAAEVNVNSVIAEETDLRSKCPIRPIQTTAAGSVLWLCADPAECWRNRREAIQRGGRVQEVADRASGKARRRAFVPFRPSRGASF